MAYGAKIQAKLLSKSPVCVCVCFPQLDPYQELHLSNADEDRPLDALRA